MIKGWWSERRVFYFLMRRSLGAQGANRRETLQGQTKARSIRWTRRSCGSDVAVSPLTQTVKKEKRRAPRGGGTRAGEERGRAQWWSWVR